MPERKNGICNLIDDSSLEIFLKSGKSLPIHFEKIINSPFIQRRNMSERTYVDLAPSPSALVESLRDIGYSVDTAIADVIDNSITAESKRIDVRFSWNSGDPWVAILDDGSGMDETELIAAMRFGSMSPLEVRSSSDLGRFGLGLKTSSFSQCRCLTVLSKKDGAVNCCQWDLDEILNSSKNQWLLRLISGSDIAKKPILKTLKTEYFDGIESGTMVLWQRIDRLDTGIIKKNKEAKFNGVLNAARCHLELVFHRFLSPDSGKSKTQIYFNKSSLDAFDPFNSGRATLLPDENFRCEGETIHVQPYVLPRHNKVKSQAEWKKYAGQLGYLHEQGFYVYRNRRLIIKGTWFRLMPKAELTKLLRVKVDIPNSLDHLWKIDVKKSHAFPPYGIRSELDRIIGKIEISGKRVYKEEGRRLTSAVKEPAWNRIATDNQVIYDINKEHPLLIKFRNYLDVPQQELFSDVLSTLESSFPRAAYFHDVAGKPEQVESPEFEKEQLAALLDLFLGENTKVVSMHKLNELLQMDPFASNRGMTESIYEERGYYG